MNAEVSEDNSSQTALQMLAAPKEAFYVWLNEKISYPRELAIKLGREDLQIMTPKFLTIRNIAGRGIRADDVVVDHSVQMSAEMYRTWRYIRDTK